MQSNIPPLYRTDMIKLPPLNNSDIFKACWICGAEGNSREHLIKASDIRLYCPNVSIKDPIYKIDSKNKKIKLSSSNSLHLKSRSLLCKRCNNSTTQPYDKAWEKLSNYLYTHINDIRKSKWINLKNIFSGESKIMGGYLQLYFIKLTGCLLTDATGYTNLAHSFGESILTKLPRSDVFLDFCINQQELTPFISDLHALYYGFGKILVLHWEYTIGSVSVKVWYYSKEVPSIKGGENIWSPIKNGKVIKLSNCRF